MAVLPGRKKVAVITEVAGTWDSTALEQEK